MAGVVSDVLERARANRGRDPWMQGVTGLVRLRWEAQDRERRQALDQAKFLLTQTSDLQWWRGKTPQQISEAEAQINGHLQGAGLDPIELHDPRMSHALASVRDYMVQLQAVRRDSERLGVYGWACSVLEETLGDRWMRENYVDIFNALQAAQHQMAPAPGEGGASPLAVGTLQPGGQSPGPLAYGVAERKPAPAPEGAPGSLEARAGGALSVGEAMQQRPLGAAAMGLPNWRDWLRELGEKYAPPKALDPNQQLQVFGWMWKSLPGTYASGRLSPEAKSAAVGEVVQAADDMGLSFITRDWVQAYAESGGLTPRQRLDLEREARIRVDRGLMTPDMIPAWLAPFGYSEEQAAVVGKSLVVPPNPWESYLTTLSPELRGTAEHWWELPGAHEQYVGRVLEQAGPRGKVTVDDAERLWQTQGRIEFQQWEARQRLTISWENLKLARAEFARLKAKDLKTDEDKQRQRDSLAWAAQQVYGLQGPAADYFANIPTSQERRDFLKQQGLITGDEAKDRAALLIRMTTSFMPKNPDMSNERDVAEVEQAIAAAKEATNNMMDWIRGGGKEPAAGGGGEPPVPPPPYGGLETIGFHDAQGRPVPLSEWGLNELRQAKEALLKAQATPEGKAAPEVARDLARVYQRTDEVIEEQRKHPPSLGGSWQKDFSALPPPVQALCIGWRAELKAAGKTDAEVDAEIKRRLASRGLRIGSAAKGGA